MPPRRSAALGLWPLLGFMSRPRPEAEEAQPTEKAPERAPSPGISAEQFEAEQAAEDKAEEALKAEEAQQNATSEAAKAARKAARDAADADFMSTARELHSEDDWDDGIDTEEARAISEVNERAEVSGVTFQVYVGAKRTRDDETAKETEDEKVQEQTPQETLDEQVKEQEAAKEQLEAGVVGQPARGATWSC